MEIKNEPFELSYMSYQPNDYNSTFQHKLKHLQQLLSSIDGINQNSLDSIYCAESPRSHFRHRCRFAITKNGSLFTDSMNETSFNTLIEQNTSSSLGYAMWEGGGPNVIVSLFPVASIQIYEIMPYVLTVIEASEILSTNLQAINYLKSTTGELIVVLIYSKAIGSPWTDEANHLRVQLLGSSFTHIIKISIMGRCKGMKVVIGDQHVMERIDLKDGRQLKYKLIESGFSNPNGFVNRKVLDWLCDTIKQHVPMEDVHLPMNHDLLEIYCGNGNHTVALSPYFSKILAIEINASLCDAAKENFEMNSIQNVKIIPCDSQKFAKQILSRGSYEDLDLQINYQFGTVLVDPPRAGLDGTTLRLISRYPFILYISCNPVSFQRDLQVLMKTHSVLELAAFDQFAYTPHLECGTLLQLR